jgi:hypothetical protein
MILTDDEISAMWLSLPAGQAGIANDFARAIEAAIMQKIGDPVAWMNPHGGVLHKPDTGLEKSTYTIPCYAIPEVK